MKSDFGYFQLLEVRGPKKKTKSKKSLDSYMWFLCAAKQIEG